MRPTHTLTLVLAIAVATAGCAAGSGDTPSETDTPAATSTPAGTDADAAGGHTVEVVDFAFSPATLEITAGSEVTWTNEDSFSHTVTAGTPDEPTGEFDEPLGDPTAHEGKDATFTRTFDEPGTYAYFCDLHPSMTGEIVVSEG